MYLILLCFFLTYSHRNAAIEFEMQVIKDVILLYYGVFSLSAHWGTQIWKIIKLDLVIKVSYSCALVA